MQNQPHHPLITDEMLRDLASPNYAQSIGDWDAEHAALMSAAIPEIAAELLKRRAEPHATLNADAQSLRRAHDLLNTRQPIHPRALTAACQTIAQLSPDTEARHAAQDILKQMEAAA